MEILVGREKNMRQSVSVNCVGLKLVNNMLRVSTFSEAELVGGIRH